MWRIFAKNAAPTCIVWDKRSKKFSTPNRSFCFWSRSSFTSTAFTPSLKWRLPTVSALGLDSTGLLLALLVTQIVAFPSSITIGRLAQKFPAERLITVCIVAYFGIAVFAIFMSTQLHFWILAVAVGMFQGGIQALSRSYFTKIIPAEKSGEYFGFLDICGKGASLMGTTVISVITQVTGNVSAGIGSLSAFFIIGLAFFLLSVRAKPQA